jgi:tryptophan-rich sensory protein
MTQILSAFDSESWIGLVLNVLLVWVALTVSVLGPVALGITIGGGASGPRDAPWTPPGWFIGAVWVCLYTLLGISLWALNRVSEPPRSSLKVAVFVLLAVLVTWTFYAFAESTRLPGLLGNIAIFVVVAYVVWTLWPHSRPAALMVAPVAVWITIATATIVGGARLYGW